MATTQSQALIGKDLTVQLTPQDVSSGGVWTANALGTITFFGQLDDSGLSSEVEYTEENISALDCPLSNPVDNEIRTTYNLTEILAAASPSVTANSLDKAFRASKFQKVVLIWKDHAASPGTLRTETAYVKVQRWNPNYRKGKCTGLMTMSTVAVSDSGVWLANPAVS